MQEGQADRLVFCCVVLQGSAGQGASEVTAEAHAQALADLEAERSWITQEIQTLLQENAEYIAFCICMSLCLIVCSQDDLMSLVKKPLQRAGCQTLSRTEHMPAEGQCLLKWMTPHWKDILTLSATSCVWLFCQQLHLLLGRSSIRHLPRCCRLNAQAEHST